jgi:tetratricopeptide (TPR) repeat protein
MRVKMRCFATAPIRAVVGFKPGIWAASREVSARFLLVFLFPAFASKFRLVITVDESCNDISMKIRKIAAISVLVLSSFAANNVAPSKAELEAMYDKAFREFDATNFPEALKQLDTIDARQPDLAESQNLRGVIFMREGIYDKAEAALHEALRIDPKFWNARFNLAEIPFLKKDWPEARTRFQELLSNNVSDLQGEAAQLIQYKILLTYLMEGKENMVDSILAKFELSPETPAVHYANAAIALQHKNNKEAKDWMATAEKNFTPQLNKLFAESLFEVGWLQKQAGQSRAALEITTPQERTAKLKAFARSRFDQAQQAFQQRDIDTARKFVEEADGADPNQAPILTLKGEIVMEQKDFDGAETAFKKAAKIDPKFREAQYNLAQIPFKKKDYRKARDRFEALFNQTPGGDKNQASQMIKFKIFMTLLLEGQDSKAQKMMEQFQFTGDTPALYYAQAAWEFKHNNPVKGNDWIASAKKIYSASLNGVFADSFYDLGWLQSPATGGSPGPASEAAAVVASAQTEASPAIEPSPIPDAGAAGKQAKKTEALALVSPVPNSASSAENTLAAPNEGAAVASAPGITNSKQSGAAGTPAMPSEIPAVAVPSLSPTVETPVAAASPSASVIASAAVDDRRAPNATATAPLTDLTGPSPASAGAAAKQPVILTASATPATALAPSHITDSSKPSFAETVGRFVDARVLLIAGLVLAAIAVFVFVPDMRRRLANVQVYRAPLPASGPRFANGNGNGNGNGHRSAGPNGDAKTRLIGGPRQVSLQLKASEPSLRRSVRPVGKTTRPVVTAPEPAPETEEVASAAPVVAHEPEPVHELQLAPAPVVAAPEPDFAFAAVAQPVIESVGPVVEAVGPAVEQSFEAPVIEHVEPEPATMRAADVLEPDIATVEEQQAEVEVSLPAEIEPEPAPVMDWMQPAYTNGETAEIIAEPSATTESFDVIPPEPMPASEFEPVAQGQPVPYQMPVSMIDTPEAEAVPTEMEAPKPEIAEPVLSSPVDTAPVEVEEHREPIIEIPYSGVSRFVSTESSILQPTTSEIMPEPIQIPTAPVIRTPSAGGSPHPQPGNAMQTAVQLTFSFEIASMQLTPTFKMGALQLRPTSRIVTMRLAPSQTPQPAMNLQVTFEISKIQPAGGGLGQVRLTPSQQQRPPMGGSPSFTVGGLQLISNFEAAPVQLTPSQQASVLVTSAFQIATVEFSPTFDISSLVLNANSKQVAVQLAGAGSIESAPMFEIANLQLGASGEISIMQLNLLGQGPRRAA